MYIYSMLLGSVIDASDAFGISRRSSPDTPHVVGSSPGSLRWSSISPYYPMYIISMLLGSVIHAPDVF
jgi:hypothetical protein